MSYQRVPDDDPYEDQSQVHWQNLPSNPSHTVMNPPPSAPPSTSTQTVAPSAPPAQPHHHDTNNDVAPLVPEEAPPSYEIAISKDIPQIHDNYDHLRGPRAVRGIEDKSRIPLDSTPYYQHGGSGAGSSSSGGVGSSSNVGSSAPRVGSPAYGSFQQQQQHHFQPQQQPPTTPIAQPSAPVLPELGRRGQIALGPDSPTDATGRRHRDADAESDYSTDSEEHEETCWSTVGEPRPWFALLYHVLILLPWALFCQVWVICVGITAFAALIFPPLGYVLIIPAVTSWRALARVDLEMSAMLVSEQVRHRYGTNREKAPIYIPSEPLNIPPWHLMIFGRRFTVPATFSNWRARRQQRRARNVWARCAKHLKDTIKDKHTTKSFFYFFIGKLLVALFIFVVIVVFLSLSIPFMLCLLPTLLKLSTKFANMQYRWSLTWLTEKRQPIVVA